MSYGILPSTYFCDVYPLTQDYNPIVTEVIGVHQEGKSNDDVKGVVMISKNPNYFPIGFEKFFPDLIAFYMYSGNITKLNGDELNSYKNLEWFAIISTQLEFVPGNLFSNNKKVKSILLRLNKIKHVGSKLFDGLDNLEMVNFDQNVCINEEAGNSSKIEELKKNLREKCKVPGEILSTEAPTTTKAPETTTNYKEVTTTPKVTFCEELKEFFQEQNDKLSEEIKLKLENLEKQNLNLKKQNNDFNLKLENQNKETNVKLEKLNIETNQKFEKLEKENEEIKKMLRDILEGLRPPTSA
jgi:hypothetical protein